MIKILKPRIINIDANYSRLSCDIIVDNETRNVWFEVEKEYEKYLCYERTDAFLIGILSWAMRLNHDIICETPVTDELLYNINEYVIPSLTKYGKSLHKIKITADIASALGHDNGVGTGCSCGVDSFHAILNNVNSKYPNCKLTHLCLNNVGSFGRSDNSHNIESDLIETRISVAKDIAKELNLKIIITNSNFADIFVQNHLLTNTYSSIFAVFCLQKLWKTYFYASVGCDFSKFNLINNDLKDSAYTDLLLLNSFSNNNLRIYSEGGAITRIDKTKNIADYEIAQKNLHVCLTNTRNCGKCLKCVRTMNTLYALGKLEKFSEVFDIEYYKKHKDFYLGQLYLLHIQKDSMTKPEYEILKKEITLKIKIKYLLIGLFKLIRKQIRILTKNKKYNYNLIKEFK